MKKFDGEKLRDEREKQELSLIDLMIKMREKGFDISHQAIMNWELGRTIPDANAVSILSQIFEKDINFFFSENLSKKVN
ncbi:MAG: helix-turn-helix transcriptional regulator [Patescibacteria group bacterium]